MFKNTGQSFKYRFVIFVMTMNRCLPLSTLILTLLLVYLTLGAKAQDIDTTANKPAKTCYWINAQIGTGTYDLNLAAEAGVLIRYKYLLTLKLNGNGNFHEGNVKHKEADVLGLLFGTKLTHGKYFNITASAGPGIVFFETRGDVVNVHGINYYGPDKSFLKPGLPIELKLWASPLPILGLTLTAGLNVTPEQTFCNVSVGIAVGKLRAINFLHRCNHTN